MLVVLLIVSVTARAQTDTLVAPQKMQKAPELPTNGEKIHSPHKATLYSAVLPGLGQAYNKKYWKIPLVYAALGGFTYGLVFNQKHYTMYKNAYRDFVYRDPANKSYVTIWEDKLSDYCTLEELETIRADWFKKTLEGKKSSYRHDRDMTIIALVGVYVLNMIDASVDAHFFNYDVSDDLTLKILPEMGITPDKYDQAAPTLGMRLNLRF